MKTLDYYLQYADRVKSIPQLQYAYLRASLYTEIDETTLDLTGWSFFDDLDGDLSAPEGIPRGSVKSRDIPVVAREWEFYKKITEYLARASK